MKKPAAIRRVDVQVFVFTAVVVVLSCLVIYGFHYRLTYQNMINGLTSRMGSIQTYVETFLSSDIFHQINGPEDMDTPLYQACQSKLYAIKQATGVQYLYTAKRTEEGAFVYVIDGLDPSAEDFRKPGDPIEPEIIPELERAISGEEVLPDEIKDTGWGKIFVTYLPIHSAGGVVGVIGIEFKAEAQYNTYRALRRVTPCVILLACLVSAAFAALFFRRISNPSYLDLSNTDCLTGLKSRNAFEVDVRNMGALKQHNGVGLLLIDLNNLKKVNDTLGHEAGDTYLRLAAQAIRESAGPGGAPYRVGGDEFAVLLFDAAGDADLARLSDAVKDRFLALRPKACPVDLSLAVGRALFQPDQDHTLMDLYRRADSAMYQDKRLSHREPRAGGE